jgi:hypothetical protein
MPKRRSAQPARAKTPPKQVVRARERDRADGWRATLRHKPGPIVFILLALHLILALLAFEPALHNGGDNAAYLALAKALLGGQGYREIYDPALPLHTQYPPLFPGMLALLLTLGFQPWVPFKLLVLAFSLAAIALSYFWMRRKLMPELAFSVALLMAVSPGVVGLSHWELSDVPFWAFTMAALFAWERLQPRDTKRVVAASVLTTLAYFTRSAGLPLIVAAVAWLAWRRRWKQLLIFGLIIVPPVFLWWLRARSQGGVDYVQQFWFVNPYSPELGSINAAGLFRRAFENNSDYFKEHLPILLVGSYKTLHFLLAVAVGLLGLFGWIKRLRHPHVSEFFLPLYIGLLLVWPAVWSGERFLVPALPLILFYAGEGLLRMIRAVKQERMRPFSYAAAALIVLLGLPIQVRAASWGLGCTREYMLGDRYACNNSEWRDYYHIAETAGRVLPDSAVVLSRKPRTFWAISNGVPGRNYPLHDEPDSLFQGARSARARYVVLDRLDRLSQAYLFPVIMRRPAAFCVMYSLGPARTTMLGIQAGADTIPDRVVDPGNPQAQVGFQICGPEYWRSREIMEATIGGR